jgi:ATP-binding cassette subfamily B protein
MFGLCKAAEKLGFYAEGLAGSMGDFLSAEITLPCIAHVIIGKKLEHFVVVFDINDKSLTIGDPARGVINYSLEEFSTIWTGHILSLVPNECFSQTQKKNRGLIAFLLPAMEHKKDFLLISLLSFFSIVLSVVASFFTYYLIDYIIPDRQVMRLLKATISIVFANLIILALNLIRTKLFARTSKIISHDLMCFYIKHLLNVEYELYGQHTTGDMISRLQDCDIIKEAITKTIITITLDVFMAITSMTVLGYLNRTLFAITLCVILLYFFTIVIVGKPISMAMENVRQCDANASSIFIETVKGIETIKSYQCENEAYKNNEKAIHDLTESYQKASLIFSNQSIITESTIGIGQVIVLGFGGCCVINNTITLGILFMFYTLLGMCLAPIRNIVDLLPTIKKAKVSAMRLQSILTYPAEQENAGTPSEVLNGDIAIKNLCYRYGNREMILDNFSLQIKGGEKIALMGCNGSGKSTLVKLLMRFYTPDDGEIFVGTQNINEISLYTLRKRIAYIPQNTFLFRGSVLDNIQIGNPEMTNVEIVEFLNLTPFKSFIEQLPMGYQFILTEDGDNLSGGQRQMISIARAMVKKGDILIMDEADSAVDIQMKALAAEMINSVYSNVTTIIITHSGKEAQMCDRIVMINAGRVEAVGTHAELFDSNAKYRKYCE